MFFAVIVLLLPISSQTALVEVRKCFETTDGGVKVGDGQCKNTFEDSVCETMFDAPINDGVTNAKVDQRCYDDASASNPCLKQCLLCCEDSKYNCTNKVGEATCDRLETCDGCTREDLKAVMAEFCPRKCGFCNVQNEPSTTVSSTTAPGPCAEGWTHFAESHSCYLWVPEGRTIPEATVYCAELKAFVGSPKSEVENTFFAEFNHWGMVWLGIKQGADSIWKTGSGKEVVFSKWSSGEPKSYECAMSLLPGGNWVALPCDGGDEAPFWCEMEERKKAF